MCISQNLDFFFAITRSHFFRAPLISFPVSQPFYNRYILRCLLFLAAVKSWVLIMDKPKKWDLDQLYGNSEPFYHHFSPKTDNVFQFATSEFRRKPKRTVVRRERSILAVLSAYQEYLVN